MKKGTIIKIIICVAILIAAIIFYIVNTREEQDGLLETDHEQKEHIDPDIKDYYSEEDLAEAEQYIADQPPRVNIYDPQGLTEERKFFPYQTRYKLPELLMNFLVANDIRDEIQVTVIRGSVVEEDNGDRSFAVSVDSIPEKAVEISYSASDDSFGFNLTNTEDVKLEGSMDDADPESWLLTKDQISADDPDEIEREKYIEERAKYYEEHPDEATDGSKIEDNSNRNGTENIVITEETKEAKPSDQNIVIIEEN